MKTISFESLEQANQKAAIQIAKLIKAWKSGEISKEEMANYIWLEKGSLPNFYYDECEEEICETDEFGAEMIREHFNEVIEIMGTEKDHFIYAPSSGCILYQFIQDCFHINEAMNILK